MFSSSRDMLFIPLFYFRKIPYMAAGDSNLNSTPFYVVISRWHKEIPAGVHCQRITWGERKNFSDLASQGSKIHMWQKGTLRRGIADSCYRSIFSAMDTFNI